MGIIVQKSTGSSIVEIIFDRPEKRNALNQATRDEMIIALEHLSTTDTRVLIITGEGEKAFIAGADITEFEGRTALDQWAVMKQFFLQIR